VDDPAGEAEILRAQLRHFEPDGHCPEPDPAHERCRRRLPAIRGLELTVTGVRAKFTYGGSKQPAHRNLLAERLAERDGPADVAAREHLL
jgi:transcriptional regulator